MKKWIAMFGLLFFVTATVAPAIASMNHESVVVVEKDKDPKKDEKKSADKKAAAEKADAKSGCAGTEKASSCETAKSSCETAKKECGESKEAKTSKAVAEKK